MSARCPIRIIRPATEADATPSAGETRPRVATRAPVRPGEKVTLYVRQPGTVVRRISERIVIELEGKQTGSVRLNELERVVMLGHTELTTSAARALLHAGVETVMLSHRGDLIGRLAPPGNGDVFLRRSQYLGSLDGRLRLDFAVKVIAAKLHNARQVVARHARNHPAPVLSAAVDDLARCEKHLDPISLPSLMGQEGEAARIYFRALGAMVRANFSFARRSRRPPKDPVNAALSFGYTLLTGVIGGAVAAAGLDPAVGLLHELDYNRPSLALDLAEEFRHPLVDRLVLRLINRQELREEHFEPVEELEGVYLAPGGRDVFLRAWHGEMQAQVPDEKPSRTWNELIHRQAERVRRLFREETPYAPYRTQQ